MNPQTLDVGAVFTNTFNAWKRMAVPVTVLTAVMVLPFSLLAAFLKPAFQQLSPGSEPSAEMMGELLGMLPMVAVWLGVVLLQVVATQESAPSAEPGVQGVQP